MRMDSTSNHDLAIDIMFGGLDSSSHHSPSSSSRPICQPLDRNFLSPYHAQFSHNPWTPATEFTDNGIFEFEAESLYGNKDEQSRQSSYFPPLLPPPGCSDIETSTTADLESECLPVPDAQPYPSEPLGNSLSPNFPHFDISMFSSMSDTSLACMQGQNAGSLDMLSIENYNYPTELNPQDLNSKELASSSGSPSKQKQQKQQKQQQQQRHEQRRQPTTTSKAKSTSSERKAAMIASETNTVNKSFQFVEYCVKQGDKIPKPRMEGGVKKRPGRSGPLSPVQREHAAAMRKLGSCDNCRMRKEKCDPGIPCKACITHYKADLTSVRCRGFSLAQLADGLVSERLAWHPKARSLESFLPAVRFGVYDKSVVIPLNFGFGPSMMVRVRVVRVPNPQVHLVHDHLLYEWPPRPASRTFREPRQQSVFPAVLEDTTHLVDQLDQHIDLLVREHIHQFPLYDTGLKVFEGICTLALSQRQPQHRDLLVTALKLITLVHIAGDITVPLADPTVARIIQYTKTPAFPAPPGSVSTSFASPPPNPALYAATANSGAPPAHEAPTPCFIRGQLGGAFPALARRLQTALLDGLEALALSRACEHFPTIVAAVAAQLMAVETAQYHAAKRGYHDALDEAGGVPMSASSSNSSSFSSSSRSSAASGASSFSSAPPASGRGVAARPRPSCAPAAAATADVAAFSDDAVDKLLRFYRTCYGGCHHNGLHVPGCETAASAAAGPAHSACNSSPFSALGSFAASAAATGGCYSSGSACGSTAAAAAAAALAGSTAASGLSRAAADPGARFVVQMKKAVSESRAYLAGQRKVGVSDVGETLSAYFDRLLARLFIPELGRVEG
ncbi:hypothetical protein BDY21DRAFT_373712 [Lineolata rhizophorae]|uniref:Zn(2)-C6 fungal-type domain-containing protein n=1 Tax=Lineolata rhizophorae TaxID=578093 RepID=A0A6A6NTR4_9PEZI|nr:hypothetical protein BDY21DRAFT_373712 [Lineolata rhizophorae]